MELISELSGVVGVVEYDGIPFASVGIGAGVDGTDGTGACTGAGTAGSVEGAVLVDAGRPFGSVVGTAGGVGMASVGLSVPPESEPPGNDGVGVGACGVTAGAAPIADAIALPGAGVVPFRTPAIGIPFGSEGTGIGVCGAKANGSGVAAGGGAMGDGVGVGADGENDDGASGASAGGCVEGSGCGFAMGCVDAVPLGSSSSPPAAAFGRGEL